MFQKKLSDVKKCVIEESNETTKALDENLANLQEKLMNFLNENSEQNKTKIDIYSEGLRNLSISNTKKVMDQLQNILDDQLEYKDTKIWRENFEKSMTKLQLDNFKDMSKIVKNLDTCFKEMSLKLDKNHENSRIYLLNQLKKIKPIAGEDNSASQQQILDEKLATFGQILSQNETTAKQNKDEMLQSLAKILAKFDETSDKAKKKAKNSDDSLNKFQAILKEDLSNIVDKLGEIEDKCGKNNNEILGKIFFYTL